jgi:hypothetical protein
MSLLHVSSRRVGRAPSCTFCDAGRTISFNWQYARDAARPEAGRDVSMFVKSRELRYGALYECKSCGQPWYLWGEPELMSCVPQEQLRLIDRWNEREIRLPAELSAQLAAIGRTPPDRFGNGSQFHETPCAATLVSGERIDLAVVSLQRHAPFEDWRNSRLATEILEIHPSPYALPLAVRVATSRADELRMGFAPTRVDLPSGESLVLNGTQSFLLRPGCKAGDVEVSHRKFDWQDQTPVYDRAEEIAYFVADWPAGLAA